MGKKNKGEGNLGKALIRDRFNQSRNKRYSADQSQVNKTHFSIKSHILHVIYEI